MAKWRKRSDRRKKDVFFIHIKIYDHKDKYEREDLDIFKEVLGPPSEEEWGDYPDEPILVSWTFHSMDDVLNAIQRCFVAGINYLSIDGYVNGPGNI